MNIQKLPNSVAQHVISYLDWKDLLSLKLVSKQFSQIFNEDKRFWARECIRVYLSFELEAVDDTYTKKLYKSSIQQVYANFSGQSWKYHFISGRGLSQELETLLSQATSSDKARLFTAYVFKRLKEPELPVLKLKRENVLCHTHSAFQNKLSEVLYEDSGCIGLVERSISRPIRKIVEDVFSNVQISMINRKSELIQARWYNFEDFELRNNDESRGNSNESKALSLLSMSQLSKNSKIGVSFLLDFLMVLQRVFSHHCSIVHNCLKEIGNGYDLITEYRARWNAYISAMLDFESILKSFVDCLNRTYEDSFDGFPTFPKFSIWRLMSKVWITQVYERENLNKSLEEAFFHILTNQQIGAVAQALENNFASNNTPQISLQELPKSLYLKLTGQNKLFELHCLKTVDSVHHPYFSTHSAAEKRILTNFVQSMIDISSNEVSIHSFENSEAHLNYPYQELEDRVLQFSNAFYQEYQDCFLKSPNHFSYFLKSDLQFLSEIFPERTHLRLENQQIQHLNSFHSNCAKALISSLKTHKMTEETIDVTQFQGPERCINHLASTFLMENPMYIPLVQEMKKLSDGKTQSEGNKKKCEDIHQKLHSQILVWMEKSCSDFAKNFEYLNCTKTKLERASLKNQTIAKENAEKNLPTSISDIDHLFYDLDKNVDKSLICKLYADKKGVSLSNVLSELEDSNNSDQSDLGMAGDSDRMREYLLKRDPSRKMPLTSILRNCIVSSSIIDVLMHQSCI